MPHLPFLTPVERALLAKLTARHPLQRAREAMPHRLGAAVPAPRAGQAPGPGTLRKPVY